MIVSAYPRIPGAKPRSKLWVKEPARDFFGNKVHRRDHGNACCFVIYMCKTPLLLALLLAVFYDTSDLTSTYGIGRTTPRIASHRIASHRIAIYQEH
jgi:hypothetical protein